MLPGVSKLVVLAVLKLALRLELGPEYDSNANRAEVVQGATMPRDVPTGSFLVRTTARGQLSWRSGRNLLRASGLIGGKVFFNPDVQDQNMLIGQLALEDRVRAHDRVELAFGGDYYDVGQQTVISTCAVRSCDRHRDFRNGTAYGRLFVLGEGGQLMLGGGFRGFQWKPDPAFDFIAGAVDVVSLVRFTAGPPDKEHEIDLSASYHFERRLYEGIREVNTCPPGMLSDTCIGNGGGTRSDFFHEGMLDFTWIRVVLLGVSYAVQLNQSNSFGQSLLRHIVSLKFSARLPWQLYLTLKGQLFVNRYLDPVLLDRQVNSQTFISIEDENRNAVIADLERPIGKSGVAISVRYSLFTNELSSAPVTFMRHVAYLGVSYRIGSK
jgi:hypothetical protein